MKKNLKYLIVLFFIIFFISACLNFKQNDKPPDKKGIIVSKGTDTLVKWTKSNFKENLKLEPYSKKINDSTFQIGIIATRLNLVDDEYLPTSESIRAVITSENEKDIWHSNNNLNYLQVISKVLPDSIGQSYDYQLFWNMKNDNGKKFSGEKITANLIIPASPKNYFTSIKFNIK
jgi:hypothetical protein